MAVIATNQAAPVSPEEEALAALEQAREHTLRLVAHVSDEDLVRVHSPIMSPLVWDLGHIAAYEDLWLAHRHAGLELLRGDLAGLYDAFETPRAVRGDIETLGPSEARAYMDEVRERTAAAIARAGLGDGQVCEMVVRHELQHAETMRQTLAIAGLLPDGEPPALRRDADRETPALGADGEPPALGDTRLGAEAGAWIEIPAGAFAMGAGDEVFAYDNERPRHEVTLGAFQIARRPVSNASWMRFAEGGGYERRELWSDEGWAWKQDYNITHHPAVPGAGTSDPDAPVCHVSWFEAEAFARAHEARLPSEAEWERAATWDRGALAQVGYVWEWTGSVFTGYPGFLAHPYREYSEVFFDQNYRVLRGGSWATSPRVKTVTFRNWDLPQRRQIFAGLRLAQDGEVA
jgi:gamma-glutamyl hercynylcysteine S-oxide synthase